MESFCQIWPRGFVIQIPTSIMDTFMQQLVGVVGQDHNNDDKKGAIYR